MPTETFFRLPEEKRQKLLRAVRAEFMRVPFPEVSINRIVHDADIPRGSFYQYFSDKEDLFRYLLQGCHERLFSCLEKDLAASGGDVFSVALRAFDRIAETGLLEQNRQFYGNLLGNLRVQDQRFIESWRCAAQSRYAAAIPLIDRERLDLQSEEELGILVDLLQSVVRGCICELFSTQESVESVRGLLVKKLQLLQRGLLRGKASGHAC